MEGEEKTKSPSCSIPTDLKAISPPARTSTPSFAPRPPTASRAEDEEKMERFYELIEGLREMRDLWKPIKRQKTECSSWKPTFELEDFAGVGGNLEAGSAAGSGGGCQKRCFKEP
ncbi:hypothetical protein HPP92_024420 [Vanilla planifolia]|uniref:Uncharacterized protein n=1 Tax=Vanilla planifolia TaxID=51239 RepID=A0A835PLX8_VANPL|nr:hypothetical protein HPP92_024420 [Vanilla planifolia]